MPHWKNTQCLSCTLAAFSVSLNSDVSSCRLFPFSPHPRFWESPPLPMFPVLLLGGLWLMKPVFWLVATSPGSGCKLRARALTAQRGAKLSISCIPSAETIRFSYQILWNLWENSVCETSAPCEIWPRLVGRLGRFVDFYAKWFSTGQDQVRHHCLPSFFFPALGSRSVLKHFPRWWQSDNSAGGLLS